MRLLVKLTSGNTRAKSRSNVGCAKRASTTIPTSNDICKIVVRRRKKKRTKWGLRGWLKIRSYTSRQILKGRKTTCIRYVRSFRRSKEILCSLCLFFFSYFHSFFLAFFLSFFLAYFLSCFIFSFLSCLLAFLLAFLLIFVLACLLASLLVARSLANLLFFSLAFFLSSL